jgi:signal transduction histidine kinase
MGVLEKLPTFVTMCVLVMIFACLKRHTRSARLTLWAVGWTLVFTHFLVQLLEPMGGPASPLLAAVDAGALQAAAVAFLVSVSSVVQDGGKRTLLLTLLAVPSIAYAMLHGYGVGLRWLYAVCLIGCFVGSASFLLWTHRKFSPYATTVIALCSLAGAWAVRAALQGSFREGRVVLLGLGFGLPAIFLCRNYWRASPAVLTISGGFFCWGAVFPILLFHHRLDARMLIPAALWETPKLFVAFGMILAVVEDKSEAIVAMKHRAEKLNRQLERFSAITSRLLSGAEPEEMCPDIAVAITEVSSFRTAVIHIGSADGRLRIAGWSGLSQESQPPQESTSADVKNLQSRAQRIGKGSFLLRPCGAALVLLPQRLAVLIPLSSATGACLGSIKLTAPQEPGEIQAEELAHIESLAGDLAVALEMKALHTQLVWSEKLAALGQLVAGVAHELNNPLTAIMGFGELIGEAITPGSTHDQLKRLMSETRRMKRITDNLLRFSRQSSGDRDAVHLSPIVQDVLTLCEYYTRRSSVQVQIDLAPDLPLLALTEDEIKQILLNLFNNSCDALQSCTGSKQIRIRAYLSGARAVIEVEDTGPGFANLNRALQPFYTTKPAGKGTGLGLSICYGIARKRGGDLRIENVEPHGGRVTLELPIATPAPQLLFVAGAHA